MESDDLHLTLGTLAEVFDALGVEWAIGGSIASTAYGEPRSTNDIDVIAALDQSHVRLIEKRMGGTFYVDAEMIRGAIASHESFNLIDERTLIKVDVFVPARGPMGLGQLERRRALSIGGAQTIQVLGPEDTVLQKLRWFELGGRQSERQWRDVVEVLRISGAGIDAAYVKRVAAIAGLADLFENAWHDAHSTR